MEFVCSLFFAITVFAAKAAGKAVKSSGAAPGLCKANERNIIERPC